MQAALPPGSLQPGVITENPRRKQAVVRERVRMICQVLLRRVGF